MKKKKGQSTIEFVFVLFAFIFFLSLSYNAVVSFAVYQYMSYANFMAARAFQPSRATNALQEQAALKVMEIYVPGIQVGGQETVFGFSSKRILARVKSWLVPRALSPELPFVLEFEVPLVSLPLGEDVKRAFGWLTLRSTVVLGREVSEQECRSFFDQLFRSLGGAAPHGPEGMEDNGC